MIRGGDWPSTVAGECLTHFRLALPSITETAQAIALFIGDWCGLTDGRPAAQPPR